MTQSTPDRETLSDNEAKVFLSYSRKDRERAQAIADVLRQRKFGVFKDTDDILPTEEWRTRLEELIQEADTIVFLLSPHSAASEVCAWEVEYANSLNKRIAPIVIDDVEGDAIPPLLARLNFIFCTPRDPFENAVATLISALNTDIDWIREHTRINGLSRRWSDAGRPSRLLPRGQDIADMERWRDTRPDDAPAVLPAQATYITEARSAAMRRWRNWIIGAVATTAMTAGLAVVAYFQSVEADTQRIAAVESAAEADHQRQVAETNAAEADRQRRTALQQLASDKLRNGDRIAGLRALYNADPNAPQIDTILAGLQTPEEGFPGEWGHTALFWNDRLSLLTKPYAETGQQDILPLAAFPAKYRDWIYAEDGGRKSFIVSATGAVRVLDDTGAIVGRDESGNAFSPCMTDHEVGKATLYGYTNFGYSACGLTVVTVSITEGGEITREYKRACGDDYVSFPSLPGKKYSVDDVFGHCYSIMAEGQEFTQWDNSKFINPIWEIPQDGFPATRGEEDIWRATGRFLPEDITEDIIGEVEAMNIPRLEGGEIIGVLNFEGATASGFTMPEIVRADNFTALASITNWGGTGGETHVFCSAPVGSPQVCTQFHGFGGYEGIAIDKERDRVAIYGDSQVWYAPRDQRPEQDEANLWIVHKPGERPQAINGIEAYGRLLDADFRDDGKLAVLTSSAVLLIDVETAEVEIFAAVEGAEAARWVMGDVLLAYGADRLTFITEGQTPESIPFVLRPEDADAERYDVSSWIAVTDEGDMVAIGRGPDIQIVDVELRAPVSGVVEVPDPQAGYARGTLRLARMVEGALELRINTRTFLRAGRAAGEVEGFLDPNAPFRN
ncbi:MAG: TIR domain-containing protein [Pikeienuella sp.]